MNENFLRKLDYRALQRVCVDERIKAVGSKDVLLKRLIEHFDPTVETIQQQLCNLNFQDKWYEFKSSNDFILHEDPVLIYYLGWIIGQLYYKYPNLSDLRQVVEKHKKLFPQETLTNTQYTRICNPILTWFKEITENCSKEEMKDMLNFALDAAADKLDEWKKW